MFSDRTMQYTTRNLTINYNRLKKQYGLSSLATTFPDGLVGQLDGQRPGGNNDHQLQNFFLLGQDIHNMQVGNPIIYQSGTDKGFHLTPGIVPMHNNLIIQTTENRGFSSC